MSSNDQAKLIRRQNRRRRAILTVSILLGMTLFVGLGGSFLFSSFPAPASAHTPDPQTAAKMSAMSAEVNPPQGYNLPVTFGQLGPRLLASGAIDLQKFIEIYKQAGQPLTEAQQMLLENGSAELARIDAGNAYFLLNFFWAVGLANANPILTVGEMMAKGRDQIGNFASTGGWTLGAMAATDLYASTELISLSKDQQSVLESVAELVYRPCCDNSTHFPDCNHGMAMLGLLELMASQNASEDEMFQAAKYVNAYWYPRQMQEIAMYFRANGNMSFTQVDARMVVSREVSSGSGFQEVHSWLARAGLLPGPSGSGGSCGVQ